MDDGCDLVSLLHSERPTQLKEVLAGTEETTTGVIRLKAMAADFALGFPVVAVNEAQTKHLFDNRYGTGQSTVDGILRATNILLAGRKVVVAGYGWVGRGIASRMSGMGAHVAIVEVDPVRALEALMDGFQVMTAADAAPWGELFVTATGNINVFRREHFAAMRDGAIMANSGHFDAELDLKALREMAEGHVRDARENVQEFDLGGKRVNLIAEGRLVNLGAAEGHPAAVMDMSFANQALSAEYVAKHHAELTPQVYVVPGGDRRRGRAAEARGARDHARRDDAGADRVRLVLEARHLRRAEPRRLTKTTLAMPYGECRSGGPVGAPGYTLGRRSCPLTEPTIAPYGAWESPFPISLLTAGVVAISEIKASGGVRWWLEGRPDEKGRQVLVRRDPDGTMTRLTPEGFNTRTRVQEYGGGAYLVDGDLVVVSDFATGRLNRVTAPGELAPLTPERAWRYADMAIDRPRNRLIAVREDHEQATLERHGEAENALVAIDLATGDVAVLVEGADFYAAPRLSPDGTQLRWLEWRHPNMPWDGTELRLARAPAATARSATPATVAGSPSDWISQPRWSPDGDPPLRRRAGGLDEPPAARRRPDRADRPRRGRVHVPRLAVRVLELRVPAPTDRSSRSPAAAAATGCDW